MPVPSTRTPVRVARGTYANLSTTDALASLQEGEIAFATDQQKLYVKQGGGLTAISAASAAAPAPADVSASPAFAGGTGTQSDPYQLTAVAVPFSGGTATSTQTVTVTGGAGDFLIVTDNSPNASGDRFAGQSVGNLDAAGNIDIQFTYNDAPGTTVDNVTYVGEFQIGTTHFVWNVVQSALAPLSQDSSATISGTVSVGSQLTCNSGTITGGTVTYQVTGFQWQKSFDGVSNFFNIAGATSLNYTPAGTDSNTFLRCIVSHADSTDPLQGGPLTLDLTTGVTIQVPASAAPVINNVSFTEDDATGNRFTSQTFSVDVDMLNDGAPVSQKALKASVTADMSTFASLEPSEVSYINNRPSGQQGSSFQAQDSDTIWGMYNVNVNYYHWRAAGHVAYIAPGTANVYLGVVQVVYHTQSGSTWRHLSSVNITNQTSQISESDFVYQGQGPFSASASYGDFGRFNRIREAVLAPDGTTPVVYGSGCVNYSNTVGYQFRPGSWTTIDGQVDDVRSVVIDKNYRAWARKPTRDRSGNAVSDSSYLHASSLGPWSTLPPLVYNRNLTTNFGVLALDSTRSLIASIHDSGNITVQVWSVDDSGIANPVSYLYNFSCPEVSINGSASMQDAVNAVYLEDLQVILVGSYRGVMRIDLNTELTANVTPGIPDPSGNYNSPSGFIEDMRTPENPNQIAFTAMVTDSNGAYRAARFKSDDGGLNWIQEWYDDCNADYNTVNQYNQIDNRVYLDHRFSSNTAPRNNSSYTRTRYSTSRIALQTLDFDQATEVQYGVLYWPVGGPYNLASAIMMRSSGTVTTAYVGASYEVQVGTVYESKVSTGVNTVSRFMVIDSTGLVTSHTGTDPGFVTLGPGTDLDLTFPASLPSGSSPDDEFPAGATIQVEVEATNSVASDTYTSGTITPA